MARGVNRCILVGHIGADPDMKYTQGGMAICTLSLATTSVRKDKEGNQQERTEWHRVKLFGKLGEIAGEYIKKGRQVYIEGEIRYDKFTGQDGVEKYITEIVANEMQMLGGGEGGGQRGGGGERQNRGGGNDGGNRGSYGNDGGNRGGGDYGQRGRSGGGGAGSGHNVGYDNAGRGGHDPLDPADDIPFAFPPSAGLY